jgi:hypothetical protein
MRDRMAAALAARRVGVLTLCTPAGAAAAPVRYRSRGLVIDCLLPAWSDAAVLLEAAAPVELVVVLAEWPALCWLQVQGEAVPVEAPDWTGLLPAETEYEMAPADLYRVVRLTPKRIDRVDEARGWGHRETLDI